MISLNPENHFFLTSSGLVDQIVKPLKDHFGLTSFVYQKTFNDGSEIRLSNQPKWVAHFYESELYRASLFDGAPSEFSKTRLVWAGWPFHSPVLERAREFNIDLGITFVEPCADGCEFFFIATEVGRTEVMSKYLANMDLIERFLDYFRDKAKPLIAEALKHKVLIPGKFDLVSNYVCSPEFDRTEFLKAINPVELTARELDCLRLLAKGYTQKMIGQELKLSPRTVECYLNQVKEKTGSVSRGDLVKYLSKLSF